MLAAALVAAVVFGGVLALSRYAVERSRQSAASTLATLLRSDRPEVRTAAAEKLREMGIDGIAPLVQALGDDREAVFSLASRTMDDALAKWQFLPPTEARRRMARLVAELDRCIGDLPAERRFVARRWAEQIVAAPWNEGTAGSDELLGHCESILRQSPVQTGVTVALPIIPRRMVSVRPSPAFVGEPPALSLQPAFGPFHSSTPEPLTKLDEEDRPSPDRAPVSQRKNITANSDARPAEPQRLVAPVAQPLVSRELELTITKTPENDPPAVDDAAALRRMSDLDVMHMLHDLNAVLAQAAEAELRRRGYRTADLPICRALVDPDPEVRRELAEALPSMHNVDPRPWLLQLSQDDNAAVRRAAEGILRTSRDPALQNAFR